MAIGGEDSTGVNTAPILTGVTGMGATGGHRRDAAWLSAKIRDPMIMKGRFKNQPRGTDV